MKIDFEFRLPVYEIVDKKFLWIHYKSDEYVDSVCLTKTMDMPSVPREGETITLEMDKLPYLMFDPMVSSVRHHPNGNPQVNLTTYRPYFTTTYRQLDVDNLIANGWVLKHSLADTLKYLESAVSK
jgi:hypothetical protein